jgi:hypothetical protein
MDIARPKSVPRARSCNRQLLSVRLTAFSDQLTFLMRRSQFPSQQIVDGDQEARRATFLHVCFIARRFHPTGGEIMALDVTPVYRNLRTRVTFCGLEAEDLFAILGLAVVMNIFGRCFHRDMLGLPMNMVLEYCVPVLSIPALMLFKYGKQRSYLLDWLLFHTKPHVYSGLERDRELTTEYLRD